MSNEQHLAAFIARQRLLLSREREEEITRGSLLLTNCGTKLLEQKGLALTGLSVVDIKIGLGGKMCVSLLVVCRRRARHLFLRQPRRVGTINSISFHSHLSSKYISVSRPESRCHQRGLVDSADPVTSHA